MNNFNKAAVFFSLTFLLSSCGSNDVILKKQDELDARVDQVVKVQTETNAAVRDISLQLSEIEAKLKSALIELEQLKPGYSELKSSLKTTSEKLDKLEIENSRKISPSPAEASKTPSSPKGEEQLIIPFAQDKPAPALEIPAPALPQTPQELYSKAFKLYTMDHFNESAAEFDSFISKFPNDGYLPNALYWKAECYYSLKKFDLAYDTFTKVTLLHPKSSKVPDAMLKSAYSLFSSGNNVKGNEIIRQLLSRFPKSEAAAKARERASRTGKKLK